MQEVLLNRIKKEACGIIPFAAKTPLLLAVFCLLVFSSMSADAADNENCLMCHKYRQIGRIDEEGKKRSYYVDENIYANTTHRNVPCRDCHTYITKLPHDPITEEVNCANECHIKPPFSKENFSHKKIIEVYNDSVHGIKADDPPELKSAKPHCKYCHLNPIFTRVEEERIAFDKTLSRCLNCHEKKGVTQAYKHITHRLRHKTSRSPQEIVNLCAKNCHQEAEMMKSFNVSEESLEAVETYTRSVHGKSVTLGSEEAADCISCHSTNAIHDIYKKDDKKSSVHAENRTSTCRQCHTNVGDQFARIDVHSKLDPHKKPVLYYMNTGLAFVFYGSVFGLVGLMLIETIGRRRDGIKWQIRGGTTWRGFSKLKTDIKKILNR
ncbi:MAG: hypothetical protein JSW20_05250 [Nitrospiraceae bacterium]|nr:MAG: hypothetical protein JSW20_05250 [Nitrospiraceae bacterium]